MTTKLNGDPLEGTIAIPVYPAPDSVAQHSMDYSYGVGNKYFDKTAPAAPVLSSPSHAATTVNLAWTAVPDAGSGVVHFDVYKGGVLVHSVTNGALTYQVTGLTTATPYAFTVKAVDGAGNVSVASNTVNVTTS